MKQKSIFFFILCFSTICMAQTSAVSVPVSADAEPMIEGEYQPTWESLCQRETPEWFRDAKFGIWAHWGPQCVEGTGDWMGRMMYMEENWMYSFHREHYGHPSEFGFKDLLPLFRAENWTPDSLVRFYKEVVGAEYFFALGNHHDNFDLWDSQYQPWNSMQIGPKRDVLGEWAAAARAVGLPFGISFHADHAWTWFEPSRRHDLKGDMAGVPYDGNLTLEDGYKPNPDGTDKWWKGLDPQQLYVQNHEPSEGLWSDTALWHQWDWGGGANIPTQAFVTNFYNRTMDAIRRYHPELIYFDATVLPLYPFSDAGLKIVASEYNDNARGIVFGKILSEEQKHALTWDVERGAPNAIIPHPWQCCNCLGDWHYNTGIYESGSYKSAATVAKLLVDIVSKNGNMLLSVPLRADGTPDEKELAILHEFGAWMKINREAIVGSRPWVVFGEGPIAEQDIPLNAQGFNDKQYTGAGAQEIRFTTHNGALYAAALAWPEDRVLHIKSLRKKGLRPGCIHRVELLGYGRVKYKQTKQDLVVYLPEPLNGILPVLKIK